MGPPRIPAPAIRRAVHVLDRVAAAGRPLSLAEISASLQAPKSSVSSVCSALVTGGLLLRGDDGSYSLGPRLAELGSASHLNRPLVQRIGMTTPSTTGRFFLAEVESVREEAEALGAMFDHRSAEGDAQAQGALVLDLLAWGADLIVVDPVATHGLETAYAQAKARGVPVISINGASSGADAVVTTDNTQAGLLAGQFLAQTLRGTGVIALVDGTAVTAVRDRVAGFLEALRPYRQISVPERLSGDNTTPTARHIVEEMHSRGVRPDAFFAINDPTAVGVAEACRAAGYAVPIVGVDGSQAAVSQMRAGGPIIGSAAQDPYELGRSGVLLGVELRNGVQLRQHTVLLPTTLVSAGHLNGYRPWDAAP